VLVDTHCHLADAQFDRDRAAVLGHARAMGVGHVIVIAEGVAGSQRAIAVAREFAVSATVGVHPHVAREWSEDGATRLAEWLAAEEAVVAVGETGLDYHYDHSPRDRQRAAFEAQLALAAEHRKPVVVHAREADADLSAMLRDLGPGGPPIILHSFSSGDALFEAGLAIGAYFSFSGMITFKSWRGDPHVVACPPDRLLIETDAPYLAPVPHRGERNQPAHVTHVAARLAALRDSDPAAIAAQTTANAARCFGSRVAQPLQA
jgi:TatD DNase family protein